MIQHRLHGEDHLLLAWETIYRVIWKTSVCESGWIGNCCARHLLGWKLWVWVPNQAYPSLSVHLTPLAVRLHCLLSHVGYWWVAVNQNVQGSTFHQKLQYMEMIVLTLKRQGAEQDYCCNAKAFWDETTVPWHVLVVQWVAKVDWIPVLFGTEDENHLSYIGFNYSQVGSATKSLLGKEMKKNSWCM